MHDYTGAPEGLAGLSRSLYSLAARVLQARSVFVFVIGDGDDLWAHHHAGTARIKGVELNRQVLDVHRTTLADDARALLADPAVELVHGEGRAALLRERERWDLVPWARATNALATLIGSIATVIVSVNFGFRAVFGVAVALHACAAMLAPSLAGAPPGPSRDR